MPRGAVPEEEDIFLECWEAATLTAAVVMAAQGAELQAHGESHTTTFTIHRILAAEEAAETEADWQVAVSSALWHWTRSR
jgi:hypothetical protein